MINKLFFFLFMSAAIGLAFYSCRKTDKLCQACIIENKSPEANAGRDTIIVLPQDSLLLDGTASHDPDGSISKYLWTKISGPSASAIINSQSAQATIKNLSHGIYQIELTVTDNRSLSAKDTVMITVDSVAMANHPPVANAGSDQTILTPPDFLFDGITAILDGSQSADPDSNINSYQWSKISGAPTSPFSNPNAVQTEVNFFEYSSYQFELKVTDSGGLSSKDTVSIIVEITDTAQQPPVASAGQDQIIFLPVNIITLNGGGSADPNNNIIAYQWTKISGPPSFSIADPYAAQTQATLLVEGVYQFELKVTDATTLTSTDTIQVTVRACGANRPTLNAKLTAFGKLSKPRAAVAVASAGNKIVFAGGVSADEKYGSSRVDIYDINTQTWSTAELSIPRYGITAIAVGNKILFAGGESGELGDALYQYHSHVDIYDASTNSWSISFLSEPQCRMAAAAVGNKVFFAGGDTPASGYTNKVEIYDLSASSWSIKTLNESKQGISAVTSNNKIYFAGGIKSTSNHYSNGIDIYDNASNSWSTSTLSESKLIAGGGVAVNNKIFWAGGYDDTGATCKVEIMDVVSRTFSFDNLSDAGIVKAVLKDNQILFFNFNKKFDIYDIVSNSWSIAQLTKYVEAWISVNNSIYVKGAGESDEIWKLEF